MIIDSSAIIAILHKEPEAIGFIKAIDSARSRRISAANFVEAAVVVDAQGDPVLSRRFDDFIRTAKIEIAPLTEQQARIAREAYRDFGKGSGHRAKLNLGDSFAYALARATGEALLFKGNDFSCTDITPAVDPDDYDPGR